MHWHVLKDSRHFNVAPHDSKLQPLSCIPNIPFHDPSLQALVGLRDADVCSQEAHNGVAFCSTERVGHQLPCAVFNRAKPLHAFQAACCRVHDVLTGFRMQHSLGVTSTFCGFDRLPACAQAGCEAIAILNRIVTISHTNPNLSLRRGKFGNANLTPRLARLGPHLVVFCA